MRLDDDPFASFLDHDPFEAALQSTEKDYNWVLGSPRSRRAEAKYNDDQDDAGAPLFTHVRIAEEKARTRSVAIGTDQRINQIVASTPSTRHRRDGVAAAPDSPVDFAQARTPRKRCPRRNSRSWKKSWKSSKKKRPRTSLMTAPSTPNWKSASRNSRRR